MVTKRITIKLTEGLEARPIAMLVQVASQFASSVYVESDDKKINAKSIMGMMSLSLPEGKEISVTANGEDEAQAIESIEKYLCGE